MRMLILLALLLIPLYALTYSSGPPPARTGAPGEQTCRDGCHRSFALNSGPGTFTLQGPTSYQPGEAVEVTVQFSGTERSRHGFEVTARDAQGQPVGTLELVDGTNTRFLDANNRYLGHTQAGTSATTWTFRWRAPDTPAGAVTFYAAGVAANADGGNLGDYVYTTTLEVSPTATASETERPAMTGLEVYPTGTRGPVTVEVGSGRPVLLRVYDLLGREVARFRVTGRQVLDLGHLPAGVYWIEGHLIQKVH